jgi:2-haloacid dehalogenase
MALYAFDAYGTLFNVHAAAERYKDAIGPMWQQVSQVWRTKHIEYSWHHAFTGRPATFWQLAARSLDYALAATGVRASAETRDKLLASYRTMDAYPEVREALAGLKA